MEINNPENTIETGRNPDGTWKKGFCPNPGGRGRNPLKDFSLKQFESWNDEQKREFLNKISPIDRWKMTEGNPDNKTDHTTKGEKIMYLPGELIDKNGISQDSKPSSEGHPQV